MMHSPPCLIPVLHAEIPGNKKPEDCFESLARITIFHELDEDGHPR